MSTKVNSWIYYISTIMIILVMLMGAYMDISNGANVVATMAHLGYPEYFAVFLGILKLLGAIALILSCKLPKIIVEWAYAGIAFDFIWASYSHYASGDPMANIMTPIGLLIILIVSRLYKAKTSDCCTTGK